MKKLKICFSSDFHQKPDHFKHVVRVANANQCTHILVGGDLFSSRCKPEKHIEFFKERVIDSKNALKKFKGESVIFMFGNADFKVNLGNDSSLLKVLPENVKIVVNDVVPLNDEIDLICLCDVPFHLPSESDEHFSPYFDFEKYDRFSEDKFTRIGVMSTVPDHSCVTDITEGVDIPESTKKKGKDLKDEEVEGEEENEKESKGKLDKEKTRKILQVKNKFYESDMRYAVEYQQLRKVKIHYDPSYTIDFQCLQLERRMRQGKKAILMSHSPPFNTKNDREIRQRKRKDEVTGEEITEDYEIHLGSADLRRKILSLGSEKLLFCLFGHAHLSGRIRDDSLGGIPCLSSGNGPHRKKKCTGWIVEFDDEGLPDFKQF